MNPHARRFPVTVRTTSAEETRAFGALLGRLAADGDVITLQGDLGAGKTTLAQGIARGLDIQRRVTSPTFTVIQEYAGRLRMYHLDCYRLTTGEDLVPLDADDWLGREGLAVIEWPDRVEAALPPDRLDIALCETSSSRSLELRPRGAAALQLAETSLALWSQAVHQTSAP